MKGKICNELTLALVDNSTILFNVVGGCGIDTSLGKGQCMHNSGIWFKYCPFCGKKILSSYTYETGWKWWEDQTPTI